MKYWIVLPLLALEGKSLFDGATHCSQTTVCVANRDRGHNWFNAFHSSCVYNVVKSMFVSDMNKVREQPTLY